MSLVTAEIALPANTPDIDPLVVDIPVFQRYVAHCAIRFPGNAAFLVGAALFNYDARFAPAPASKSAWIKDDGRWVEWDEQLDLGGSPRVIRLQAYNLDDTWPRTLRLRIEALDFPNWAQLMAQGTG